MEVWKDVVGFEGIYEVSNIGRVKSLKRNYFIDLVLFTKKEKILTPTGKNYLQVKFCQNGIISNFYIHRLVAISFIPNPNNLEEVNHKNGIKSDNGVENLEWCTRSQNIKHAFDNRLKIAVKGNKNGNAKLSDKDALEIKHSKTSISNSELSEKYGVDKCQISLIRNGKSWKHL